MDFMRNNFPPRMLLLYFLYVHGMVTFDNSTTAKDFFSADKADKVYDYIVALSMSELSKPKDGADPSQSLDKALPKDALGFLKNAVRDMFGSVDHLQMCLRQTLTPIKCDKNALPRPNGMKLGGEPWAPKAESTQSDEVTGAAVDVGAAVAMVVATGTDTQKAAMVTQLRDALAVLVQETTASGTSAAGSGGDD